MHAADHAGASLAKTQRLWGHSDIAKFFDLCLYEIRKDMEDFHCLPLFKASAGRPKGCATTSRIDQCAGYLAFSFVAST